MRSKYDTKLDILGEDVDRNKPLRSEAEYSPSNRPSPDASHRLCTREAV